MTFGDWRIPGAPFLYFCVSIQYASVQAVIFDSCAIVLSDLPSGSVRTDRFEGLQDEAIPVANGGGMRRVICFGVLILAATLMPMGALAQALASKSQTQDDNLRADIELLRSDVRANAAKIITVMMQLDDKDAAVFWPIYRDYESELSKLYDEKVAGIMDYADHYLQMTDAKADDLATRALQWEDQRTDLKKKYYERFKKALSPITAARFLQIENQILMLVDLQVASSLPIIEASETSKEGGRNESTKIDLASSSAR
jgi:sulfite reductase alpha subunit-like flavoprotein